MTTLADTAKKEIAMQLVSSAENSSLDWRAQYGYIEDIGDGRGYTGGIIGFTSGTGDMLRVVERYAVLAPKAGLLRFLLALRKVNGTASHTGLGAAFVSSWKTSAPNATFRSAQDSIRDYEYFTPAVNQALADGLSILGQFIYYDALVMHGPGYDRDSFGGIRAATIPYAPLPSHGGKEYVFLNAFLNVRKAAMLREEAHSDTSRIETMQRLFLAAGNYDLHTPLTWKTYGDSYTIR
ncbi:chitosanase [Fodinicola feengrottensis]|uniref:Chitosanase n=1 Tax=Fodinicola feengrottensis TaxID=435914 RepID=A0ABP4U9F7_9ACTN